MQTKPVDDICDNACHVGWGGVRVGYMAGYAGGIALRDILFRSPPHLFQHRAVDDFASAFHCSRRPRPASSRPRPHARRGARLATFCRNCIVEAIRNHLEPAGWRLEPGGLDRPLDDFTASAIRGYLDFRNQRWPATTSPYLLVTRKTAHTSQPVSVFWMNRLFRGLPVTAEQLRDDRIVEEALAGRADPLHLAAVFGLGPRTGLRYAQAARPGPLPATSVSDDESARRECPPGYS